MAGGTKSHENIAYGLADIGISVYGALGKVPDPHSWRLWHYMDSDLGCGYKAAHQSSLIVYGAGTASTTHSIFKEITNDDE